MEIRRRRIAERDSTDDVGNATDTGADKLSEINTNTYWLTRIVFLRFLGLLYCKQGKQKPFFFRLKI